jgi:uncharacterized membrane protein
MTTSRNIDLLAACAWAAVTLVTVAFTDSMFLRLCLSVPLLLFVTGHAVLRAIGPFATSQWEYIVYAVGASIAVCLAGGLVLNWVAWLTPVGWAVWLAAVTGSGTAIALYRHHAPEPVFSAVRLPRLQRWQATSLGVAALVTCGAYGLTVWDATHTKQFKYTEFWMLPGTAATPGQLLIGIKSAEAEPQRFAVEVKLDGQIIALWRSIEVAPGDTWTQILTVAIDPGHPQKAEARLYDGNVLYRKVSAIVPGA